MVGEPLGGLALVGLGRYDRGTGTCLILGVDSVSVLERVALSCGGGSLVRDPHAISLGVELLLQLFGLLRRE